MSGLSEFRDCLESVEKYSDQLSPQALFIAGIGCCKSGCEAESILKYLAFTQKLYEKGQINNTNKTIIEYHFYKGEIKDAKKLLKDYKLKNSQTMPKPEIISTKEILTKPKMMEVDSKQAINPIPKVLKNEPLQISIKKTVPKMELAEIREIEFSILDIINGLRKIDEKETLRLRKQEEEKRLQAEYAAKELKQKFETEYQEKLKKELDEMKKLEDEALKCMTCKQKIKDSEVFMLDVCSHTFHKNCAKEYVAKAIDDKKIPIQCLICKAEFGLQDIKYCAPGRLFKKYEDLTFKLYLEQNSDDYNSCPTSTCSYLFEYDYNITE